MKHRSPYGILVGGISSSGRELPDLGGEEFRVSRSQGPYIWDEQERRYIDLVLGFGATILGHKPIAVAEAVCDALASGPMPGFAHRLEEEAAIALTRQTRNLNRVVFLNSGSEAVHLACQIARAHTGRQRIVKFAAAYDGWYDGIVLGKPGTPEAKMGGGERPGSSNFTLLRFNDPDDIDRLFAEYDDIAGVLIEPVLANAGCIVAKPGYLETVQETAKRHGALLIADEVLMGFRICHGLSSHFFGLEPDLAALGKAIGSGITVAAVVGSAEAMESVENGKVARAGTYNGNPIACAAVKSTANELARLDYGKLLDNGNRLRDRIQKSAEECGLPLSTSGYGSVFTIWFSEAPPINFDEALSRQRPEISKKISAALRREGVLVMPNALGRCFVSAMHGDFVLDELSGRFQRAIARVGSIV